MNGDERKMLIDKKKVLDEAPKVLNQEDNPWEVSVEGDKIIGTWKWMDARFLNSLSVSEEQRQYTFVVTLKDNGTWKETNKIEQKSVKIGISNEKISLGMEKSFFKGKMVQKSFSFGLGQNKQNGELETAFSFLDTSQIKLAIRDYLKKCGWKKNSLFR